MVRGILTSPVENVYNIIKASSPVEIKQPL
jgi:hypothetical protein